MGGDVEVPATESTTAVMEDENPLLIIESMIFSLEAVMKTPPKGIPIKETLMEKT